MVVVAIARSVVEWHRVAAVAGIVVVGAIGRTPYPDAREGVSEGMVEGLVAIIKIK